jgi:uncharacterized oligopeptide transporter (OPT) family protein
MGTDGRERRDGERQRPANLHRCPDQLGERVTNLGRRQSDLENEMRSGFKQIESSMAAMSSEMRSSVAALSTNMAERNRPQWQALGVALTYCTILGGLASWPINAPTTELKTAVSSISEKMVTPMEMEWRTQRVSKDRALMEASIKEVRHAQVPREELDYVFNSFDQRF